MMLLQSSNELTKFYDDHIKSVLNVPCVLYITDSNESYFAYTCGIFFIPMIETNKGKFVKIIWNYYEGRMYFPIKITEDKDEFEDMVKSKC